MKARTGKTWDQWFKVIDDFGGAPKGRREIGAFLQDTHKLDAWASSTLNVEYEAARGVLEKDGRPKGYMICATKTIAVPADKAFDAWSAPKQWDRWLSKKAAFQFKEGERFTTDGGDAGEFKKIKPGKAIKFTWDNPKNAPGTVAEVTFPPKGADKCTVMVAHDRIQTRAEADALRESWGAALDRLKTVLEA
jgi:uncharacterized protein YndB with AHSA1/START domain